jgi:hypothetical protein
MSKKKLVNYMASKTNTRNSWDKNISIIEKWLTKRGFRLIRGNEKHVVDSVDFDLKLVLLSKRSKSENQFYSILHECGHILNRDKNFPRKYKTIKESEKDPRKLKTMRYLVEEVEEETEAWRKGEALANKLNIVIDSDKYYTYASRFLMTYIVMAGKGKDYLVGGKE